MTTVYYYKIFCTTEQQFVYQWTDNIPTACPNNNTHDIGTVVAIRELAQNSVLVDDRPNNTNGHYAYKEWQLDVPSMSSATGQVAFPFDISIIGVIYKDNDLLSDCIVNTYVNRHTPVAGLIAETPAGSNTLAVSSTEYMQRGYILDINGESLGQIISIDSDNACTVETPPSVALPPGSIVLMSVWNVRNVHLGQLGRIKLRARNSNSSALPTGFVVSIEVQNNSLLPITFEYGMEFFY